MHCVCSYFNILLIQQNVCGCALEHVNFCVWPCDVHVMCVTVTWHCMSSFLTCSSTPMMTMPLHAGLKWKWLATERVAWNDKKRKRGCVGIALIDAGHTDLIFVCVGSAKIWSTTACAWPGTRMPPQGILCMASKHNFWSHVGFVPTVSLSLSCPIVSPQFPSLDMFLSMILSLHPSHLVLSVSLFNGACFLSLVLSLYNSLFWPCHLQ